MKNQVNLLQGDLAPVQLLLSAKQCMAAVAAAILIGALMTVPAAWQYHKTQKQLDSLQRQQSRLKAQIEQWQSRLKAQEDEKPVFEHRLKRAEQLLVNQKKLHTLLKHQVSSHQYGYADEFVALAKQAVPGVWLTEIEINRRQAHFVLRGKSVSSEKIEQYIERLGNETVFQGKQLRSITVERPDGSGVYSFEVSTNQPDSPS